VRVLIAGVSARAAADSAARAGFDVTAVDAFADLDQHPAVHLVALAGRFTAVNAANAAAGIDADAVVYLSNFENHPVAVANLQRGRALWGNSPDGLRRVRDPFAVHEALTRRGFSVAEPRAANVERSGRWLVKPFASGGGQRIRDWDGRRAPRRCYLQKFIEGVPGSIVFVSAGGRAVPLGVSRQLVGDPDFGASGFRYCGNVLVPADDATFARDEALVGAACRLADAVADEFRLVGVNGIDFVARDGTAWLVEINPRWTASMELVERAYRIDVFDAHVSACTQGALPRFDLGRARVGGRAFGKAIVYARDTVTLGDTRAWLPVETSRDIAPIRDVPHPGQTIAFGDPICTVFADAGGVDACRAALARQAGLVDADLSGWVGDVC